MSQAESQHCTGHESNSVSHTIGRQLQNPCGFGGWLIGQLMRIVNNEPNWRSVNALNIKPDDTVLEMGFGPGHAVKLIAKKAHKGRVIGVDQSTVMVAEAGRRNRRAIRESRVRLHCAKFESLPIQDRSIDKILAVNVIYFWRDLPAIAEEMKRILRPDGQIVIYATDASSMLRWSFASATTHRLFDAKKLRDVMRLLGFAEREVTVQTIKLTKQIQGLLAVGQHMPPAELETNSR